MKTRPACVKLNRLVDSLFAQHGPQHWWPGQNRVEVMVGAILTQNTDWRNVELALRRWRRERSFSLSSIRAMSQTRLEALARPAGFYRQKARTIRALVALIDSRFAGSLRRMAASPQSEMRDALLGVRGIGPETADAILLYALGKPVFIADGYAQRVLSRHGIVSAGIPYETLRTFVEACVRGRLLPRGWERRIGASAGWKMDPGAPRHRPSRASRFAHAPETRFLGELHALLVRAGSTYCHPGPECGLGTHPQMR